MWRRALRVLVGLGSLAALIVNAILLSASLTSPTLGGYESQHWFEIVTLLVTLAAVLLVWARFLRLSDRRPV
jgi:hypothetical protein